MCKYDAYKEDVRRKMSVKSKVQGPISYPQCKSNIIADQISNESLRCSNKYN